MSSYANHLRSRLGGLTRRQVITAMLPEDILQIFQEHHEKYPTTMKYTPQQKADAIQMVVKIGYAGAAAESGVHYQTLLAWVNHLCTTDSAVRALEDRAHADPTKNLPFLHMLRSTPNNAGTCYKSYSAEHKVKVASYAAIYGVSEASHKYDTECSVVRNWLQIAKTGLSKHERSRQLKQMRCQQLPTAQVPYGLKDLSPLAAQVAVLEARNSELEAENEKLKDRLKFFEQFKQAFKNL